MNEQQTAENLTTDAKAPAIALRSIEKFYDSNDGKKFHALKNVNLDIAKGEIYGIIGRSGAGKSTLIRLINLLERPTSGQVLINQEDITQLSNKELLKLRQKIGMVFQHFNLLSSKTILANVLLPLKIAGYKGDAKARALELLELVGLKEQADKYPAQLSGGQKQRVGIARSLANNPEILLCDEATSALDPETTKSILALLKDIAVKFGITIVMITHSMDVIRNVCDRVAVIDQGVLIEEGQVIDVFLNPQQATTKSLLSESGLSTDHWEVLGNKVEGHVIKLTYKGDNAARPLLSRITSQLGVDINILEGTVGTIGEIKYGQLVIAINCSEAKVAAVRDLLNQEGVSFEEIK